MAERAPRVFTIPAHQAFSDALVAGLMRRFGGDRMALARGLVLLPNNRARLAVTQAFVRASGGALLLPRLAAIGDPDLGEAIGAALDPIHGDPPSPAVSPLARRMILARLVAEERAAGHPVDAGEAVRLAGALARTLDQLLVEEIAPARLREIDLAAELSDHWQRALAVFSVVLDRWPAELARLGRIEQASRRLAVIDGLAARWRGDPPAGFVCAAGITDPAPAVARLLRVVAQAPRGLVVLAGLDRAMPQEEWDALGPHDPDPAGLRRPAIEVHPQFHLKALLARMGVARGEVAPWRDGSEHDALPPRSTAIANALAPAAFTGKWTRLAADQRQLAGVAAAELANPAEEAQAIALALREALETPGRTAALVTPDRALARRVAALLGRWGIAIDDSAGQLLSTLPPGTLLLAIVEAAVQDFAPSALLALVKHPLVAAGRDRPAWLEGARRLDRALRGPRPAPGPAGIAAHLAGEGPQRAIRAAAADWWQAAQPRIAPVLTLAAARSPVAMVAALREAAAALAGDEAWRGAAGRAAADLLADLEEQAAAGPAPVSLPALAAILRQLMDEIAVRPPQGGHPRLAIYGQIEARLQSADLMVLAGLNEGVWPGIPAPDPWLAPRIRAELGLPGLERRIGIAAHDFGQGLGAPAVLITRARRDARSPTIASRLWLRLEALAGANFQRADALIGWARALDRPDAVRPAPRPGPSPPAALRPQRIAVTQVDRLAADPFAFYAARILDLSPLEMPDADPSAAWRGSAVHAALEGWAKEDGCAPGRLAPRVAALFDDPAAHPLLRALWQPRLMAAVGWIEDQVAQMRAAGREVAAAEGSGEATIAGVRLHGRFDRIDRLADGTLAIVDYKTGKAPSTASVAAGFSLQLGLIGAIAEAGGFAGLTGRAGAFEYWSLARHKNAFGSISSPVDPAERYGRMLPQAFVPRARDKFGETAGKWLTGDAPFTAKLHPEFAPYSDYDQLMRRDEWYGRE